MTRLVVLLSLTFLVISWQPQSSLRKQLRESDTPQPMTAAELAELADPMFVLALRDNVNKTSLDEIEKLIAGESGRRNLFVVHEELQNPAPSGHRRAVITFTGTNQGVRLNPNVALSAAFNPGGFVPGFIEAWGWDDARSRYNYYKLDGDVWTFRGSSENADQLTTVQRRDTCMACHINGGPLMKELPIPWNNWHSFRNLVPYLSPASADHWAVAESARFKDLRGAETLETQVILPSIRQFNGRRLNAMVAGTNGAFEQVVDGPRALRPLLQTTEYTITSADQSSGLHPLPKPGTGPSARIPVPDTFFLNANLLAGGGLTQYEGIGVPEARDFVNLLLIEPSEYVSLVQRFKTTLGGLSGETHFGWFVPEPSHIDNQMIDLLLRRGVITREFAAAALSVDLETPVFSTARASLLAVVPANFRFIKRVNPGDLSTPHPDELTKTVISNLEARRPAAGSAEAEFLAALQHPDPVSALRTKSASYRDRVRARLANPQQRQDEIGRLYAVVLRRRAEATAAIPALVESRFLFPRGISQ